MKNLNRETGKTSFIQFQLLIFYKPACLRQIFHGLWADSVSPRMNTIASCDQFKPIRIEENLVVNYNS